MLYAITDGCCAPQPYGVCSCAFLVKNDSYKEIYRFSMKIGSGINYTNNVGEFRAIEEVLKWFELREEKELTIVSDSKLVINQMSGDWKVKGGVYYFTYLRAKAILELLLLADKKIYFSWFPREYTLEADELAKRAILVKEVK